MCMIMLTGLSLARIGHVQNRRLYNVIHDLSNVNCLQSPISAQPNMLSIRLHNGSMGSESHMLLHLYSSITNMNSFLEKNKMGKLDVEISNKKFMNEKKEMLTYTMLFEEKLLLPFKIGPNINLNVHEYIRF